MRTRLPTGYLNDGFVMLLYLMLRVAKLFMFPNVLSYVSLSNIRYQTNAIINMQRLQPVVEIQTETNWRKRLYAEKPLALSHIQ